MSTQDYVSTGKPGINGAIYHAPAGTPLPTSVNDTLDSAFEDMGFVSEDGWVNSNTSESAEFKAWGGKTVKKSQTGKSDTFQVTFIEMLNKAVLQAAYGYDNVSGTLQSGLTVRANDAELDTGVWVCDTIHGDYLKRTVIAKGQVTEVGDITYKDDELVGYPLTISAYPGGWADSSDQDTHKEYIAKASNS